MKPTSTGLCMRARVAVRFIHRWRDSITLNRGCQARIFAFRAHPGFRRGAGILGNSQPSHVSAAGEPVARHGVRRARKDGWTPCARGGGLARRRSL